MNRILGLVGCAVFVSGGVALSPPVHAQTTPLVTVTFRLTVNGTAPAADSFVVSWGETGLTVCAAPCTGGGQTYVQTETFPTGVTESFVFARASGKVAPGQGRQEFGKQTVPMTSDRSVSAFFTYAPSELIAAPLTGSAPPVVPAAALVGSGIVLLMSGLRRRLRTPTHRRRSDEGP